MKRSYNSDNVFDLVECYICFNIVELIFMNTYLLCIPVMLYHVQFSRNEGKKNGIKQWKE